MAYGLTPYDKKRYKQSQKRRRQMYYEEKTGRIIPFGNRKRNALLLIIALLIISGVICGFWFAIKCYSHQGESTDISSQNSENEIFLDVVNKRNPLEGDYKPLTDTVNGVEVARISSSDLRALLEAAENQNVALTLKRGYISFDEQQLLYEEKLLEYLQNPDYTQVRAEASAADEVPPGGMSEAQTGLLIEFDFEDDAARQWLENNCVYYGFVLRYPESKKEITTKDYSSSLYRYTGKENALKMRSYDMCLEEYNEYISQQKAK